MIEAVHRVLRIFPRGKAIYPGKMITRSLVHLSKRGVAFFESQGKGGGVGNSWAPLLLSWVGFFEPNDLDPSLFSRVPTVDLFLASSLKAGFRLDWLVELGCKALRNSLVLRATSINVEKEERDRLSKKIRYSSNIPWRQMSNSTLSSTGSQKSRALSWNLFIYIDLPLNTRVNFQLSKEEFSISKKELDIEHGLECPQSCTEPDFRLTY